MRHATAPAIKYLIKIVAVSTIVFGRFIAIHGLRDLEDMEEK